VDRYYELEDQRRWLVMLPGSPSGLSREDAVGLLRELQDALRVVAALRAAPGPLKRSAGCPVLVDRPRPTHRIVSEALGQGPGLHSAFSCQSPWPIGDEGWPDRLEVRRLSIWPTTAPGSLIV
jgi:hypothetical protein